MPKPLRIGGATVLRGDCIALLPTVGLVDAIVTDPPYHLGQAPTSADIGKRWFTPRSAARKAARSGFMDQLWDGGDIAFRPETWGAIGEALKPGGYLLAFGGSRTHHRIWCAIEDAGFVIQDTIMWLYGQGFPKGRTQLKPAFEPICVAYKPGGKRELQIEECRIAPSGNIDIEAQRRVVGFNKSYSNGEPSISLKGGADGSLRHGDRAEFDPTMGRWPANLCHDGSDQVMGAFAGAGERHYRDSKEPSSHRRYTAAGGTNFAALPGPRGGSPDGRWPANVCHDGSDEAMEAFAACGERSSGTFDGNRSSDKFRGVYGTFKGAQGLRSYEGNSGSVARFFYCAKANKADRAGSKHPTVKPVALMRWLVRLVTPPGGTVLDPFAGSGTTGAAALAEGRNAILIEREAEYIADIKRRLQGSAHRAA